MLRSLLYRLHGLLQSNTDRVNEEARRRQYGLDPSVRLGRGVSLMGRVSIGAHTHVNGPGLIFGGESAWVRIGQWCAIGNNVNLRARTHDLESPTGPDARFVEADITIGDHVWIGANVFIVSGVTVGDGAVIGANAVVTKDVAPAQIVAGVPARVIGTRSTT
jgi:serine acetyltransferase